jgi:hypothetical protein
MNNKTLPYPHTYESGCFAGSAEMNWLKPIFEKEIYSKIKNISSFPFLLSDIKSEYYCEIDIAQIEENHEYIVYLNYGESKLYEKEAQYSFIVRVTLIEDGFCESAEGCTLRGQQIPLNSIDFSLRSIFNFN